MNYLSLTVLTNWLWLLINDINDFLLCKIAGILADVDSTVVDVAVPIHSEVGDDRTCLFLSAFQPLTESDVCTDSHPEVSLRVLPDRPHANITGLWLS